MKSVGVKHNKRIAARPNFPHMEVGGCNKRRFAWYADAHKDSCVGIAANMIGVRKRIIAFLDESGRAPTYTVMLNPEIIKKDCAYNTEEGCLSLLGGPRPCKRYKSIKVKYQTLELQTRIKIYTGWTAQTLQHEVDHCNGVLI